MFDEKKIEILGFSLCVYGLCVNIGRECTKQEKKPKNK